jgi:hypothetical protein
MCVFICSHDPTSEHYNPQRAIDMTSGNIEMIKQVAQVDEKELFYNEKRNKGNISPTFFI